VICLFSYLLLTTAWCCKEDEKVLVSATAVIIGSGTFETLGFREGKGKTKNYG